MKLNDRKVLKEVKMWVVAGLSLRKPINVNDVRRAVEEGFEAGKAEGLKIVKRKTKNKKK